MNEKLKEEAFAVATYIKQNSGKCLNEIALAMRWPIRKAQHVLYYGEETLTWITSKFVVENGKVRRKFFFGRV